MIFQSNNRFESEIILNQPSQFIKFGLCNFPINIHFDVNRNQLWNSRASETKNSYANKFVQIKFLADFARLLYLFIFNYYQKGNSIIKNENI